MQLHIREFHGCPNMVAAELFTRNQSSFGLNQDQHFLIPAISFLWNISLSLSLLLSISVSVFVSVPVTGFVPLFCLIYMFLSVNMSLCPLCVCPSTNRPYVCLTYYVAAYPVSLRPHANASVCESSRVYLSLCLFSYLRVCVYVCALLSRGRCLCISVRVCLCVVLYASVYLFVGVSVIISLCPCVCMSLSICVPVFFLSLSISLWLTACLLCCGANYRLTSEL